MNEPVEHLSESDGTDDKSHTLGAISSGTFDLSKHDKEIMQQKNRSKKVLKLNESFVDRNEEMTDDNTSRLDTKSKIS